MSKRLIAIAALWAGTAQGQTPSSPALADFPAGALMPTAAQLTERLNGQLFSARLANGTVWRLDYKSSSGYVFVDISSGGRDTGRWRADDGSVCYEFRAFPSGCTDFRLVGDVLYFKRRGTGEVVALEKN